MAEHKQPEGRVLDSVSQPRLSGADDANVNDVLDEDTMPAIIELLVLDDINSDNQEQPTTRQMDDKMTTTRTRPTPGRGHTRQASSGKVMTAAQFEMYRRAMDFHAKEAASRGDESEEEYGDDDDVKEREKTSAAQRRQKQETYLARQRIERRKVSGGETQKAADADLKIAATFKDWDKPAETPLPSPNPLNPPAITGIEQIPDFDDDEDVPLAVLARSQTPGFGELGGKRPATRTHQRNHSQHQLQPIRFVERPQTRMRSHSPQQRYVTAPPAIGYMPRSQTPTMMPRSQTPAMMPRSQTPAMVPRSQTPSLMPGHAMGHQRGASTGVMMMGNHSMMSLAPPQYQRPHSSGGLINAIDSLQSPAPQNHRSDLNPPKDFLGGKKRPKFYGRWT